MLPKQENLSLARQLSIQALLGLDLEERAARSGGRFFAGAENQTRIEIRFLGHDLRLSFPQGTIETFAGGAPLTLREEILILHYLQRASGNSLSEKWFSFAEIPGGTFYHPVFLQRCKAPLVKFFGETPERLLAVAAEEFQGETLPMGDVGVKVQALPFVPLGLVLWRGDPDFPPEGNVLFDASIPSHLPVEDIVILAETIVWKLIKSKAHSAERLAEKAV